jgi:hypothetical protein
MAPKRPQEEDKKNGRRLWDGMVKRASPISRIRDRKTHTRQAASAAIFFSPAFEIRMKRIKPEMMMMMTGQRAVVSFFWFPRVVFSRRSSHNTTTTVIVAMLLLFFFFFFLSTVIIGIHAEPSATHQPTTRAKKERKKSSSHSIMPVCVATNDIASFDYLFMHIVSV